MLIKTIKEKLNSTDIGNLYKKVGYNSSKKFIKTLNKLKSTNSTYAWIYSANYDLVYNSKDFLTKLFDVLDINESLVDDEINKVREYYEEKEKFRNSYIFVNTYFRRKNEPIFPLAFCEKYRNISLYRREDLLFKSNGKLRKNVEKVSESKATIFIKNKELISKIL
ncbi:hypothetical protein [Poseidonibacter antarcticus]|uniref:hypothetical protein n=1 Tax=Poseidonibacter antarcticus TaxID=2478538 RepID=UPI000EF4A50E|nr:hypothetical protein [Poseidonibacter antarcticus]